MIPVVADLIEKTLTKVKIDKKERKTDVKGPNGANLNKIAKEICNQRDQSRVDTMKT